MTAGQDLALAQVEDVVAASSGGLELLAVRRPSAERPGLVLSLTVLCKEYERAPGGLPLRDRERFEIVVGPTFPFDVPNICSAHTRFAGHPHVQVGSQLCLYLSKDTEWDPADGMLGFLSRLHEWLRQGALGQLDPIGGPLHPPVAYPRSTQFVVVRENTPEVPEGGWYGLVLLSHVSARRTDIVGWKATDEAGANDQLGSAILLDKPFEFFEFPRGVGGLILALMRLGVTFRRILLSLQWGAVHGAADTSLLVVIGSPMRGIAGGARKQHLVAWEIPEAVVGTLLESIGAYFEEEERQATGADAERRFIEWACVTDARWCRVLEARPEITNRRDSETPMAWFAGKSVAIWGCGAIGGHVAEYVVRAGARRIQLVDEGIVTPGILVRQRFDDRDIGESKVVALAERLCGIFPGATEVEPVVANVVSTVLGGPWHEGIDLVIDCTASRTVLKKLEYDPSPGNESSARLTAQRPEAGRKELIDAPESVHRRADRRDPAGAGRGSEDL